MAIVLFLSGGDGGTEESGLTWEWDIPSKADEEAFYDLIGWAYTSTDDDFDSRWDADGDGADHTDLHGDSEGDDLWIWDQQDKRYATTLTQNWRDGWLAWYKNTGAGGFLEALDDENPDLTGLGLDHMYGQGLATVYHDTSDSDVLTVLNGLRTRITGLDYYADLLASTPVEMSHWEARGPARHLLVACYAYEATGSAAWGTVRDTLLDGWLDSTDWEEGGVIAAGGMYFASREQAQFASGANVAYAATGAGAQAAYDDGRRFQATWHIGILAEGFWRAYIQTGRTDVKDKLVKMARYVHHYAHRSSWSFPNVGSRFGHEGDGTNATGTVDVEGGYFHNRTSGDGTSTNAVVDCSYDLSLINLMVMAYKLTTEQKFINKARIFYKRGIRFDQGSPFDEHNADGQVPNFLDTQGIGGGNFFAYNKGALQYCYQVIENGGKPIIPSELPAWVEALAVNEWVEIPNSVILTPNPEPAGNTGASSKIDKWCSLAVDRRTSKVYSVGGGGHNDYAGNEVDCLTLETETPSWANLVAPSSSVQVNQNYYNDGKMSARHSYYGVVVDEARDRIMIIGGAVYGDGNFTRDVACYSISSNAYLSDGTVPDFPSGIASEQGSAVCLNPLTGDIYKAMFDEYCKYTHSSNSWSEITPSGTGPSGHESMSAMDTTRGRVLFAGGGNDDAEYLNLSTNAWVGVTFSGAQAAAAAASQAGMFYCEATDRYYIRQDASGGAVAVVHPTTFAVTALSTTGGAGIPATDDDGGGVYNKFLYVPRLRGAIYVPLGSDNAWFLRLH